MDLGYAYKLLWMVISLESTILVGSSLKLLVNVFSVQMQIPTIYEKPTLCTLSKRLPSSSSIKG